jgi:hypothetical protein
MASQLHQQRARRGHNLHLRLLNLRRQRFGWLHQPPSRFQEAGSLCSNSTLQPRLLHRRSRRVAVPRSAQPRQIENTSIFNGLQLVPHQNSDRIQTDLRRLCDPSPSPTQRRTWISSSRFEMREPPRVGSSLFWTTTLTQTKSTHQLQFRAEEDSRTGEPPLVGRLQFSLSTRNLMITPSHFRVIIRV